MIPDVLENIIQMSMQLIREIIKYQFDYFKHMTTLSTGSILIIIAFLEGIFKKPEGIFAVIISIFCFLVSLIGALYMLQVLSGYLNVMLSMVTQVPQVTEENVQKFQEETQKKSNSITRTAKIIHPLTDGSFLLGVIMFLVFALINLID